MGASLTRRIRCVLLVSCWIAVASVGGLVASAEASSTVSSVSDLPSTSAGPAPATGGFAPYPGGDDITTLAQSGDITAGSCTYRQAIDDPHLSSGDVSVHGWWLKIVGTCPAKAEVTVYLQAYWCDSIFGCRWITVDADAGKYYAGGGAGKRATARKTCSDVTSVGWRGYVDIDLIGVGDPSGYTYSATKNLLCSP